MSGMWTAIAAVVIAAASTSYQIYSGNQASKEQSKMKDQAAGQAANQLAQAKETAKQQEESTNRAYAKTADSSAILAAAQQASKTGAGSTMLTGTQGVDLASLNLGKNTLLGA